MCTSTGHHISTRAVTRVGRCDCVLSCFIVLRRTFPVRVSSCQGCLNSPEKRAAKTWRVPNTAAPCSNPYFQLVRGLQDSQGSGTGFQPVSGPQSKWLQLAFYLLWTSFVPVREAWNRITLQYTTARAGGDAHVLNPATLGRRVVRRRGAGDARSPCSCRW